MLRARVTASLIAAALVAMSPPARALAEDGAAPASDAANESPYRLGTAARPFAWSTAIGDLNADGRPDFAIADRVGRLGGGFSYSLEFSIAGVGSRSVTFDAPDAALAVSLLDVDHDHHLDVVVSAPITRTVVRIWLNDGHGRFRETMPRPSSNARVDDADAAASHTAPDEAPPTTAPRPAPPSLSPASHRLTIGDDSRRMPTIDRRCPRLLAASHAASRGPPRG